MGTATLTSRLGPDGVRAASLAAGAVAGCAVLAAVDPNVAGRYPACPTAALLGVDCPACGTLRAVHALTRGRVGTALDHNALLAVAVPLAVLAWWRLVRRARRRGEASAPPPAWAVPAAIALVTLFTIARNVPFGPFRWLGSGA